MSKINRAIVISVVSILATTLVDCGGRKRDFSSLGEVTVANLWISASDGSKYGWKISDPKELSRIVAFVDSDRKDWSTPWLGIPMPIVEVQVFDGDQAKGTFGAGKDFFETQRDGEFFSKHASSNEIHNFFDAAGLDDAAVKKYSK
ncbi:MAG: hypothetical protein ACRD5K_06380 [Candidatus Acidiferrales bacterium]